MSVSVVAMLAIVAFGAWATNETLVDREGTDSVASSERTEPTAPAAGDVVATVSPDRLVRVDRVWLIDRGDGTFDWGVSVRTPPDAPMRSGVVIDVRLIDADDEVVEESTGVVDGVGPESIGAVSGRLADPTALPVRIEFDVAVGAESEDRSLADRLSLRAVERTPESVRGRIRSDVGNPIVNVTMVLLWFDDAGDVVAAVPQPVQQVRPGIDLRFDIDLGDEVVPDGPPDLVVWTR